MLELLIKLRTLLLKHMNMSKLDGTKVLAYDSIHLVKNSKEG